MNTVLLIAIVLSVSLQQVAKKAYNQKVTGGAYGFSAVTALTALIVFLFTSGGTFSFSFRFLPYSLLFAVANSVTLVFGFLAVLHGPLSLYSLLFPIR